MPAESHGPTQGHTHYCAFAHTHTNNEQYTHAFELSRDREIRNSSDGKCQCSIFKEKFIIFMIKCQYFVLCNILLTKKELKNVLIKSLYDRFFPDLSVLNQREIKKESYQI